jgi:hypothetical protein
MAIIGAYVLAGELTNSPSNIPKALENYQAVLGPYIDKTQKLFPGVPQITNPQTKWGYMDSESCNWFLVSGSWCHQETSFFEPAHPTGQLLGATRLSSIEKSLGY